MRRTSIIVFLFLLAGTHVSAQLTTLDWKQTTVSRVRMVETNIGNLNAKRDLMFDFPGLINCEFPPNSREEHITEAGIWVGAVVGQDTFVSVTLGESSPHEFYATDAPWDTMWVVQKGDTVDIPYWPGYVGISDQDFVCRYSDYGPTSLRVSNHVPLYLDVIQTSYAWGSTPLDEFVVLNYYIIPTKTDLQQVYVTSWFNGNIGYGLTDAHGLDDESFFRREQMLAVCQDVPGGADGNAFSPLGEKIFPPKQHLSDSLKVTFVWYNGQQQGLPSQDWERYQQMTSGEIMVDQQSTGDGTKCQVSMGPYSVRAGDTLHLVVGVVLGEGLEGMYKNADYLDVLIQKNFRVPSPPPTPPLRIQTLSQKVLLEWDPREGDVNPETYHDPARLDTASEPQPFEGYRVYKSTVSSTGPWTLLAEYDIPGNRHGQNTGLSYAYVDSGLLNNLEYYYAVTSFSKPDSGGFPSQESSKNVNSSIAVPGPEPPATIGEVAAVPNPYRGDIAYYSYNPAWEKPAGSRDQWMEQDRRIQFINLPQRCTIKIYTVAGDLVQTIDHDNPTRGYEDWNLTSSVGQAIASGIYLFTAEDLATGNVQVGKFVIIK